MTRLMVQIAVGIFIALDVFAAGNIIKLDRPANDWQSECLPIGNGRLGCMIYGGIEREQIQFNEDTLWIGDESDTGSYQAFGDLFIELGQVEPKLKPAVSNPSGHSTSADQTVTKSIDENPNTKWCMEHGGKAVIWQIKYESAPGNPLQSYSLTSADDVPGRDPRKWTLEGSNDGKEWAVLDRQNIDKPFPKRHMKKVFKFKNNKMYNSYRFTFEPIDRTHFQVAEVALALQGSSLAVESAASVDSYRRELNIAKAVSTVEYKKAGVTYRREYFASHPANVLVFRLTADRKGAYSGAISLKDAHGGDVKATGNTLSFAGKLSGTYHKPQDNYAIRMQYEAQAVVLNEGGSIEAADGKITFNDCDSLVIMLDAGTDYLNQRDKAWKREHPHKRIEKRLAEASKTPVDDLLKDHIKDYQELYNRVTLDLGDSEERKLEERLFQFARYLMISCSRPGCMPANLQGLWNQSNRPPWRSDYHTDVNIQMNYWFVDNANLSECFTPLSEWLWSVVPVKREATKKAFGARGWAHRAENGIFGGASFKWYLGDAAWVMQNIWDHYAYTMDREYLETRAYPLMKNLCEFWEDTLIEWPDGKLVSPKSQSPEHGPELEGNSYEQQLVYDLFTNYIEASKALDKDEEFRKKVESMRSRLLGPQIGKWGQLQEWAEDRDDPKDQHRHLSHLIAVHPGRQISDIKTPKFAEAARVSLNARGDGGTGWSKGWKISMWARLHDGNRAYKLLREQIKANFFPNLFGFHPPFQIDGNFGYAAGVCEMLMQSQTGIVDLLPALPDAWSTGSVKGLKARGGFVVDMDWKDGMLGEVKIKSLNGSPLSLKYGEHLREIKTKKGKTYTFDGKLK